MSKLIEKYCAVAVQYANQELHDINKEGVKRNLKRMKDYFEWAYEQYSYAFPVKFVAFPEYGTNGYPACNIAASAKASEPIPGPITDEVGSWAKEYDCFIATGIGELLPEYPMCGFNSAIIIDDKGEVCLIYRKTNPWIPDEFWPSPYDFKDTWDLKKHPLFPVAKTTIGNWGGYICNDGMTPEPARQLAFNGAEFLYHPELLMDPWICPPFDYFDLQTRWNSVVNVCYHVAVHAAFPPVVGPPYGMQGGSLITDFEGRLLACGPKAATEAYAMAFLSVRDVREYRTTMPTHNGLNSFKGELYDYFTRPVQLPPAREIATTPEWTVPQERAFVKKAMDRFWADYYKDSIK